MEQKISKYQELGFAENYTSFLNGESKKSGYIDPDAVGNVSKTTYYYDLTKYLNLQKNKLEDSSEIKNYVFLQPQKCTVSNNKENQSNTCLNQNEGYQDKYKIACMRGEQKKFLLTSDQLGFSANEEIYSSEYNFRFRYPLVKLKEKWPIAYNKDQCFNFISMHVLLTRTLGGAFVWPTNDIDDSDGNTRFRDCSYNRGRGVRSYIEDRADLTLMEIKNVLDKKAMPTDLLYPLYTKNSKYMKEWLDLFKDFKEYVTFFSLQDFVIEDEKAGLVPINLETGNRLAEKYVDECKTGNHSIKDMEPDNIKKMLERLENMIIKRSARMELIINSSNKENG